MGVVAMQTLPVRASTNQLLNFPPGFPTHLR